MVHLVHILIYFLKILNIFGNATDQKEISKSDAIFVKDKSPPVYNYSYKFYYIIELILGYRPQKNDTSYYLNVMTSPMLILCNDFTKTEKNYTCDYAENILKYRGKILFGNFSDEKEEIYFRNTTMDMKCFPPMAIRSEIGQVNNWHEVFPLYYTLMETENKTNGFMLFGCEIMKSQNDVKNIAVKAIEAFEKEFDKIKVNMHKIKLKNSKRGCYTAYSVYNDTIKSLSEMLFADSIKYESLKNKQKNNQLSKTSDDGVKGNDKNIAIFFFTSMVFLAFFGIILIQLLPHFKSINKIQPKLHG